MKVKVTTFNPTPLPTAVCICIYGWSMDETVFEDLANQDG
jgi:hypothetical protein